MTNRVQVLKEYNDGLIIQWNNTIWVIRADGDQPTLWPTAIIERNEKGQKSIIIPKGTDVANANAVLTMIGVGDLF